MQKTFAATVVDQLVRSALTGDVASVTIRCQGGPWVNSQLLSLQRFPAWTSTWKYTYDGYAPPKAP